MAPDSRSVGDARERSSAQVLKCDVRALSQIHRVRYCELVRPDLGIHIRVRRCAWISPVKQSGRHGGVRVEHDRIRSVTGREHRFSANHRLPVGDLDLSVSGSIGVGVGLAVGDGLTDGLGLGLGEGEGLPAGFSTLRVLVS